jgi:very-short-patch-repair endonuclease
MKGRRRTHNREDCLSRRRELRSSLTSAEASLWRNLKSSALDGKKFRRQHSIGPYIVDFYCPECRVIVELDGAKHYDVFGAEYDDHRTAYLESLGLRVIRFENRVVFEDVQRVLDTIRAVLRGDA